MYLVKHIPTLQMGRVILSAPPRFCRSSTAAAPTRGAAPTSRYSRAGCPLVEPPSHALWVAAGRLFTTCAPEGPGFRMLPVGQWVLTKFLAKSISMNHDSLGAQHRGCAAALLPRDLHGRAQSRRLTATGDQLLRRTVSSTRSLTDG